MSGASPPVASRLPPSLVRVLRRDPGHAAELGVLYAMARLAPNQGHWAPRPGATEHDVVRSGLHAARRDGAVTGTSFVVGMPAALLSIYLSQLRMVLALAALHGLDPTDPRRAAEFLVLQGKYATVEEAAAVLASVPVQRERERQGVRRAAAALVRQVPSVVSMRVEQAREKGWVNAVLSVLGIVSFVVPFLGVPVCMAGAARTSRKLAQSARRFYGEGDAAAVAPGIAVATAPGVAVVLPELPSGHDWRLLAAGAATLVAAAAATIVWLGGSHRHLGQVGLGLLWAWVGFTYARLWWLLGRHSRRDAAVPAP